LNFLVYSLLEVLFRVSNVFVVSASKLFTAAIVVKGEHVLATDRVAFTCFDFMFPLLFFELSSTVARFNEYISFAQAIFLNIEPLSAEVTECFEAFSVISDSESS